MRPETAPRRRHPFGRKGERSGDAVGLPWKALRALPISASGVAPGEFVGEFRSLAQLRRLDRRPVAAYGQGVLSVPNRARAGTARQSKGDGDPGERSPSL